MILTIIRTVALCMPADSTLHKVHDWIMPRKQRFPSQTRTVFTNAGGKDLVRVRWGRDAGGHLGVVHDGGDSVPGSVPNNGSWWSNTLMKNSPNYD